MAQIQVCLVPSLSQRLPSQRIGQELVAYGARTSRVCEHLELGHLDATCPALTNIPIHRLALMGAPFCPARIPIVLLPRLRRWFLGIKNLVLL